jgi:hypothetical protein
MAKSKQRKGHKQKIAARNQIEKIEKKMLQDSMLKHIEELKKKFEAESGTTQNPQ